MLLDTCEADADSIEDRDGEDADGDCRRSAHMECFGHFVVGVNFAEMEYEGGEQVPEQQAAGIAHEDFSPVTKHIVDKEDGE